MNANEILINSLQLSDMVIGMYLEGLSDEDLFVRPIPACNHILWQMGHLIQSDHHLVDGMFPGRMPSLPAGFAEKFKSDTSKLDTPESFPSKTELLAEKQRQRDGMVALLKTLEAADFDQPGPENFRAVCPTVGSVFALIPQHWMMHAGQWAVVRRKLGHPPVM